MKKILGLILLLNIESVWAWGQTGHRAVGEIAWRFLTLDTRLKLKNLIGDSTLAKVATWPDEIKSDPAQYKYTFSWHYTDWPDDAPTYDEEHNGGSLIKSIREQILALRDPRQTPDKKIFAVKFLAHLIGDLHMPLHVGNGQDTGGNACRVTFMGTPTNLHSVWDEGMIDFTKLSFTEIANFVSQNKTKEQIESIAKGEVLDWALESKNIRLTLYPTAPGCKAGATDVTEMPKLSYEYSYKFMPVVERRLFEAGVRLAEILNKNL